MIVHGLIVVSEQIFIVYNYTFKLSIIKYMFVLAIGDSMAQNEQYINNKTDAFVVFTKYGF